MEKSIEFNIPKGYVLDEENSTDEKVVYKLEEKPIASNWEEVCKAMFLDRGEFRYLISDGDYGRARGISFYKNRINLISETQGEKLKAINQLMTVAKYLNDLDCFDKGNGARWCIYIIQLEKIEIGHGVSDFILFKSKDRAEMAIKILGEDIIKLALTPNNY